MSITSKLEIEMLNETIEQAQKGLLTESEKENLKLNLACKIESTKNIVIKSKSRFILSLI